MRSFLIITAMTTGLLATPALALTCSVSSTGVNFGTYRPFDTSSKDNTGTVTVSCDLINVLVNYRIEFSTGSSGTYTTRYMPSGPNNLNYNLYIDSSRQNVWGNGTSGTSVVTDSIPVSIFPVTRNYTIYGRIPAQQLAKAGSYADTIQVTIIY